MLLITDATSIDKESISNYNTTYFYPYSVRTLTKRMGTTDTLETVKNYWNHIVLDAARKRIFPYVQSSTQTNKLMGHSVVVTCGYDNYGNPNSIVKSYSNGPTETTTTTYENIVTTSWLIGRPTAISIQYTGGGNTITRTGTRVYATNSNNLSTETWFAGTNNQIVDSYLYSLKGLVRHKTSTANGASRTITYTYYSDSIRISMMYGPTNKDFVAYSYDSYGRIYTKRDFTDFFVTLTFDDFGRSTRELANTGVDATVAYSWESPTVNPKPARYSITKTGTDGSVVKSWMDKLGREIRNDVKGMDATMIYTVSKYNLKGQLDSISDPYLATGAALWNRYIYDDYGRKTNLYKPSGKNTTWQYSNNIITETTNGKPNTKTYSSDGTISSATDNGGTLNYTYYPDRQVKTITAPGSITTSMQYDVAGNQTQLIDPSSGTITYTYDGFRQLTSQQNARSQTTQLTYHSDGRINQKISSAEGTSTYYYNLNAQITSILNSTTNIKKRFVYDRFGRDSIMVDSIPGTTKFTTKYSFDSYGRLNTITHPSGIVETKTYNQRGYLIVISAGGANRWTVNGMNAFQQVTSGTFGSNLNTTIGYNAYGYISSQTTGTIQDYSYNFNPASGNLNWRQNNKGSNLKEDFYYDNLDRLDYVKMGSTTTLDMTYDSNKGAITSKTDVGTMQYATSGKPYAISTINPATPVTPPYAQTITYTSFDKISTISENNYNAAFTYGIDNQRAKMVVQQGGSHLLTRWYPSATVMKDSLSGTVKTYTYIGGDAYTAPCVAIKQGTSPPKYYYLIRDHLGSITHISDTTNAPLFEYSYDSWGRKRDPASWANYPTGVDTSFTCRGFTGHETLPWFNLINMNGRAYDPLVGQFLSPDNEIQNPLFTQNYNRYVYCLNNPLSSVDLSGYNYMQLEYMAFEGNPYRTYGGLGGGGRWSGGWESAHQIPYAEDYAGSEGGGTMAAWATPGTALHYWVNHPGIQWQYENYGKFSEKVSEDGGYTPEEPLSAGKYDIDGYTYYCPGETSVVGNKKLVNFAPEVDGIISAITFPFEMAAAAYDFGKNYYDMREADFRNSDKYFHAKANFQASHRGSGGQFFAEHFSNLREIWDQNVKGYPRSDSELDQEANLFGRTQANFFAPKEYRNALKIYRPALLPKKY